MRTATKRTRGNTKVETPVRVAIYTRKSVSEGLEQVFNTLHAQRESIEAYVLSQKHAAWESLPAHYDDGGFSGATTDRPAFQQLLQDIKAGKVDVVAVYKIDRLSRSLADFANIIRFFEQHGVEFVSVTQQFTTANAMGKLTLNILMSFAEFERGIISERTRDKLAASRKKGMWIGGRPMLGYDVAEKKLVVNPDEAKQVNKIFELYLEIGSLHLVAEEINSRGWTTKAHTTKAGKVLPGRSFDKSLLQRMLTAPVYIGKVEYDGELYEGKHDRIIDMQTWDAVQTQLEQNRQCGSKLVKNKWDMLLAGIVRCGKCGASFGHHYSKSQGCSYHSYACQTYLRRGSKACPGSRLPTGELDRFVIEKLHAIGTDPTLISDTLTAVNEEAGKRRAELTEELKNLEVDRRTLIRQRKTTEEAVSKEGDASQLESLQQINERLLTIMERVNAVKGSLESLETKHILKSDIQAALTSFTPIWDQLFPKEREHCNDFYCLLIKKNCFFRNVCREKR
ncbi:MAG: recombinase family protein [Planctomycetota bacterium]